MIEDNAFGEYLKQFREENNLSTNELHKITGVSQPYISQLENGGKKPSRKIIHKIAIGLTDDIESEPFGTVYKRLLEKAGYSTDWKYLNEIEDLEDLKASPRLVQQAVENFNNNISTPIYLNENNEGNFYFFKNDGFLNEDDARELNNMIKGFLFGRKFIGEIVIK